MPYMLLFFIDKLLVLLVVDAFLIGSFSPNKSWNIMGPGGGECKLLV
jgi:hypothetical protein